MDSVSSEISGVVNEISKLGGEMAPMFVHGMILLLIVLFLAKYVGRLLTTILIRIGIPERRAAHSVTALHVLILIAGALIVLMFFGIPGELLFQFIMVGILAVVSIYIIVKPYLPRLPFVTGDIIEASSVMGTVSKINIMHTQIKTFDGKIIFIPNHKVMNDKVVNFSLNPNRRIAIDFFIPYDQDIDRVKEVVGKIVDQDARVLEKPAPRVVITNFSPEFIEMQARIWVQRKHRLVAKWDLNDKVKSAFDEEGIRMAAPRLEVSHPRRSTD
jgi:small conductance mechanosensitive channel